MQQGKYSQTALGIEQEKAPGKYSQNALGIPEDALGNNRGGNDVKMSFLERVGDTFTGKSRTTPETENAQEIRKSLNDVEGGFTVQAGIASTMNPKAQIDIIKEHIPDAKFRQDEHQNTFITLPNGEETILNRPGFSEEDIVQTVSQILPYIPAAKAASVVTNVFGKIGVGSILSLLTNLGVQKTSQELGSKQPIDKTEAAIAGAAGGMAEAVVPAFQGIRNMNRARRHRIEADDFAASRTDAIEAKEAAEGLAEISPEGEVVGFTQPQQTMNPGQMTQARSVAETNEGGRIAREVFSEQNEQIIRAKDNLIESIAPPEALERGAQATQDAATSVIDKARAAREEAASPLYKTAFDSFEGVVPLKGVRNLIVSIRKGAANDGQLKATMNKTLRLLKGSSKEVEGKTVTTPPTLEQLHNAKIEIGDMIEGTGGKPLSNTIKRKLTRVQQKLTEVLKEASPDYGKALKTFEEMSPAVDELVNSRIGKISNKKELRDLSNLLFDSGEINPAILKKTKLEIRKENPQAWDDMLRINIEKRISKMKTETDSSTIDNVPAKMYNALFGNDANQKVLLEAATPELKRNLIYFRTVLNRARKARPGGSDTSSKTEAKLLRAVNRFFGLVAHPVNSVGNLGRGAAQSAADARWSKALFNTDFIPNFKKFTKLPHDSPASARVLAQLLDDVKLVESDSK